VNKPELLRKAELYVHLHCDALKYAARTFTDEQATAERKRLKNLDGSIRKAHIILSILSVIAVFAWMYLTPMTPRDDGSIPSPLLGAFLVGGGCVVASFWLRDIALSLFVDSERRKLLRPLAGSEECVESLDCLKKGGPLVAEWRDLAISERGQLRQYDFHIMHALCIVHLEEVRRGEQQNRYDAACREVHGIPQAAI
jgi:hypothetical protein